MYIELVDIYQPIALGIRVNDSKVLSYFALHTEIVFTIIAKARYGIPRVTMQADTVLVSLQDPAGVVRIYRAVAARVDGTSIFVYRFQNTDVLGAWKCSVYSVLNDNVFITVPFIGFILE